MVFFKVNLYIFGVNDTGGGSKRGNSFWDGVTACSVAGISDGIIWQFFCRMFSGIFYTLVLCGMQKAWISETIYRLDR